MNNTAAHADGPSTPIPQPACTPDDLRAALEVVAPRSLPAFDRERTAALKQARQEVSADPLRSFAEQWAVYVAIERHPDRATRLHELEARAAETDDLDEGRAIVAEVGRILRAASVEAGLVNEGHSAG